MKKKIVAAIAVLLLLLLGGLGWALMPAGVDPHVARVTELQQKLFSERSQVSPEERRAAFGELRQEFEKLTPEQRDKLMRDHPPPFVRQMQKNIRDFFDLPADKRKEALDRQINEMESRRRQMTERFAQAGGRPGGGPGFGGGPGGGPGGNRGPLDPERRQEMTRRMLDNTTPQDRAMMGEYMRQMQDRRRERGMPPLPRRDF